VLLTWRHDPSAGTSAVDAVDLDLANADGTQLWQVR
jgi:hypothetical protein